MAISNSPYIRWFKLFNSERREVAGGIETFVRNRPYPSQVEYERQLDLRGDHVSINHFRVDLSNTDAQNPLEVTLFTLSNGCYIKGTMYYTGTETNSYYDCRIDYKWYDKDNNSMMDTLPQFGGIVQVPKKYYSDLSSVDIWYMPPSYMWQGDTLQNGDNATHLNYMGQAYYLKYNASPYDPPQLAQGNNYDLSNLMIYYDHSGPYLTTDADVDLYLTTLKNGGDGTPITPMLPSDDTSEPGGGDQGDPDYNPFSDPIDFPGLPTGGTALGSGFIRVYNPSSGALNALATKLWSNDFFTTIQKIMANPMEAIVSLHSLPFNLSTGTGVNIRVGNFDTTISAPPLTAQYYTIDCGNISLPEHWASALDYSPYTTVDIFIPFVGVRPLQIDDVMGKVLNLKYNIDALTGSGVAMIKSGNSVLYTYNTQLSAEIPYSMSSFGRLIQSTISVAGMAVGGASGGAGAVVGRAVGGALGTALSKHSDISRGGALGGASGVMGDFTPYLIIHRPIQSLASGFSHKKGYPSNISATLSSVSGYTVVDKIHLNNIDCTDTEREEINSLLREGVII